MVQIVWRGELQPLNYKIWGGDHSKRGIIPDPSARLEVTITGLVWFVGV